MTLPPGIMTLEKIKEFGAKTVKQQKGQYHAVLEGHGVMPIYPRDTSRHSATPRPEPPD